MNFLQGLGHFTLLDAVGVIVLLLSWFLIGQMVDRPPEKRPSVSQIMAGYRRVWMRNHVTREPRVFDAILLTTLRNSTTFFASGCMLAIGGTVALMGNTAPLEDLAQDLALAEVPRAVLEVKLVVTILLLAKAFFNFVWSHRLFGYCAVVMAAVPNDQQSELAYHRAAQSAELNILASRSFNRGLRTIYFTLAAVTWLLGAVPLILASIAVFFLVWRREFSSQSRQVLLQNPPVE